MHSFVKFIIFVAVAALMVMMLFVEHNVRDAEVFFKAWFALMLLLAVPVLLIMAFVLNSRGVIRLVFYQFTQLTGAADRRLLAGC